MVQVFIAANSSVYMMWSHPPCPSQALHSPARLKHCCSLYTAQPLLTRCRAHPLQSLHISTWPRLHQYTHIHALCKDRVISYSLESTSNVTSSVKLFSEVLSPFECPQHFISHGSYNFPHFILFQCVWIWIYMYSSLCSYHLKISTNFLEGRIDTVYVVGIQ